MSVKHAEAKKKVLTEIMKLMDKVGGHRLAGKPLGGDQGPADVEDAATEAPSDDDMAPKKPGFTFAHQDDDASSEPDQGDDEEAPSDEELDAMEAKLKKHGRR